LGETLREFGETSMLDVVFIFATLGFFAVAIAYVRGCGRLK
jgi:hypothetical protein